MNMPRIKWTREKIIRTILDRESAGLSLRASVGDQGVDSNLYQAARRVFGSWSNAIQAAGIAPTNAMPSERWTPTRILLVIRNLSTRKRPLTSAQLTHRYGHMAAAARRMFGSWNRAILAAGVDPAKLRRGVRWTPEAVIEAILVRALRGDALNARNVQPPSLVDAGQRLFGSWEAAKEAAGIDPVLHVVLQKPVTLRGAVEHGPLGIPSPSRSHTAERPRRKHGQPWTQQEVLACLFQRMGHNKRMNADAVSQDDDNLYRAGMRCFGSWKNTLIAAGLNPKQPPRQGHGGSLRIRPNAGSSIAKSHATSRCD